MALFTPFRYLLRGFGGPAAALISVGILTFPVIVGDIRQSVGRSNSSKDQYAFVDEVDIYKISAMLVSINKKPLDNVLYNKMSKLIFEKKINLSINLINQTGKKSDPYRIVIAEYKTTRGYDE